MKSSFRYPRTTALSLGDRHATRKGAYLLSLAVLMMGSGTKAIAQDAGTDAATEMPACPSPRKETDSSSPS
jgi:hypothetical protein